MAKPKSKPVLHLARFVRTTRDASQDKPLLKADALALFNAGELHELRGVGGHCRAFAMPRTTADMLADRNPWPSRVVQEAITRAIAAGAKL